MNDHLPNDPKVIISALPEMRQHFEDAAKRSPCHAPILNSIAHDMRQAEAKLATANDDEKDGIATAARFNIVSAHQGLFYYPTLEGDFKTVLDIAKTHEKKSQSPKA